MVLNSSGSVTAEFATAFAAASSTAPGPPVEKANPMRPPPARTRMPTPQVSDSSNASSFCSLTSTEVEAEARTYTSKSFTAPAKRAAAALWAVSISSCLFIIAGRGGVRFPYGHYGHAQVFRIELLRQRVEKPLRDVLR